MFRCSFQRARDRHDWSDDEKDVDDVEKHLLDEVSAKHSRFLFALLKVSGRLVHVGRHSVTSCVDCIAVLADVA